MWAICNVWFLLLAEFTLLKKDIVEGADASDPGLYQDPNIELEQGEFLSKVLDAMETLGWKPYQVM